MPRLIGALIAGAALMAVPFTVTRATPSAVGLTPEAAYQAGGGGIVAAGRRATDLARGRRKLRASTDDQRQPRDPQLDGARRTTRDAEVRRAHGVRVVGRANGRLRHRPRGQRGGRAVGPGARRRHAGRPLDAGKRSGSRSVQSAVGVVGRQRCDLVEAGEPASRWDENPARFRVALSGSGCGPGSRLARRTRRGSRIAQGDRQHEPAGCGVQRGQAAAPGIGDRCAGLRVLPDLRRHDVGRTDRRVPKPQRQGSARYFRRRGWWRDDGRRRWRYTPTAGRSRRVRSTVPP